MTQATALAAAAIIQAAADRAGHQHWHRTAQDLTDWANTQPAPQED